MTIMYEINPPKISAGQNVLDTVIERIESISSVCDGIHLTESVLGIPRIPEEFLRISKEFRRIP